MRLENARKPFSAWVFARAGSRGIKDKNRSVLGDYTLTQLAVLAAKSIEEIGTVYVSTDSSRIADDAEQVGAVVPFLRPQKLAGDATPEIEAWKHAIQWEREEGADESLPFISVPPTSPLRLPADIQATISLFLDSQADLALTVKNSPAKPGFNLVSLGKRQAVSRVIDRNSAVANFKPARRQDSGQYFMVTTVCYVANRAYVQGMSDLFDGKVVAHLVPEERGIDIDSPADLSFARYLFERARDSEH